MCGILAALGVTGSAEENRRDVLRRSRLLRHRGPDQNAVYQAPDGRAFLAFERLMIVDPTDSGRNSEIYNHVDIRRTKLDDADLGSKSDSAIIGHLYARYGDTNELWNSLDGIFACALWDERTGYHCIARDPIGVCSLYWGRDASGGLWAASEMKALMGRVEKVEIFPPGHVYRSTTGRLERWFRPDWLEPSHVPKSPVGLPLLRETVERAVVKRLMCDAPWGILLSGGLDSSLVASIAVRHLRAQAQERDEPPPVTQTFSIGLRGSPDLVAARRVAAFLGTQHHEFVFTVEEGVDALEDLIWHIESVEQVRAAVPMYLLARRIKALGIKVVLSGEGADEAFGGYLYFHAAPSPLEFHAETVRLLTRVHQWDVLRANKAPFSFGVEARVPFLDKELLRLAMNLDPAAKMPGRGRIEKHVLRAAFDEPEQPYLPADVLWRQKEQFSDGVGYDWVDGLKAHAERVVSDADWEARETRFPCDPPRTREYFLLRSIFERAFPDPSAWETVPKGLSIACSTPEALAWNSDWVGSHEISGRAVAAHADSKAGGAKAASPLKTRVALKANGHVASAVA